MKLILLLLLFIPNTQKVKILLETTDEKGSPRACLIKISQNGVVIAEHQTAGRMMVEVEVGEYNMQIFRCVEMNIVWRADRNKRSIIIVPDCENPLSKEKVGA